MGTQEHCCDCRGSKIDNSPRVLAEVLIEVGRITSSNEVQKDILEFTRKDNSNLIHKVEELKRQIANWDERVAKLNEQLKATEYYKHKSKIAIEEILKIAEPKLTPKQKLKIKNLLLY